MSEFLQVFVLLPLLAFLGSLFISSKNERVLSIHSITTSVLQVVLLLAFIVMWAVGGFPLLNSKELVFFKSRDIEIFIDFYFDKTTAVFALVGAVITLAVNIFSRYYLHRDEGFKRYFSTILLFFFSFNLVVFSGNFETLFLGWEVLGICSFLLIAFYRDRYLPVKNSLKVISIYRLGDICLILTMWMSHQLWHENITFAKLNDASIVETHVGQYYLFSLFLAAMVVVAASTKSAQLPFSSWLPRAMEGPTTSSAIFYGSLSVHLGVFLLIRTYPYWSALTEIRILIILLGAATSLVATSIARVQSTVKTQIAYASITQIGLMLIEVALGWHILALVHFSANALLRTYQLLVSPSVLSYRIHGMVFNFMPQRETKAGAIAGRIKNSLYILSIKEWNLDRFLQVTLWNPFKWMGRKLGFKSDKIVFIIIGAIFLTGLFLDTFPRKLPASVQSTLPVIYSLLGLILVLSAFSERVSPKRAWLLVIASQLFISISVLIFHDAFGHDYMMLYLSGAILSAVGGYLCILRLEKLEGTVTLNRFHGHSYEYPGLAFLFFFSGLGLVGFPFTPTFIGIDLLFSHIHRGEILIIAFISLSFIFMELAVLRMYARMFLGPHVKGYHAVSYRSS